MTTGCAPAPPVAPDDAAFAAYAGPLADGSPGFTTTRRFGAPATIQMLEVAGVADGPGARPPHRWRRAGKAGGP